MPLRLTEPHVMSLIQPHLNPGEEVLFKMHGIEQPWWTYIIRIGAFFWKYYVVAATNQRLILIQMTSFLKEKAFESIDYKDLDHVEMGWGLLMKPLVLRATQLNWKHKINIPRISPIKGNLDAALGVVSTWQERKQLPAARAAAQ